MFVSHRICYFVTNAQAVCYFLTFFFQALIMEKVKGDDSILQTIIKSGKGDLYAELVYFLRYGTLR